MKLISVLRTATQGRAALKVYDHGICDEPGLWIVGRQETENRASGWPVSRARPENPPLCNDSPASLLLEVADDAEAANCIFDNAAFYGRLRSVAYENRFTLSRGEMLQDIPAQTRYSLRTTQNRSSGANVNDALFLHCIHFALTITFHYLFPQLTMGLAPLIVVLKTLAIRTRNETYNESARFWTKIFGINFALA